VNVGAQAAVAQRIAGQQKALEEVEKKIRSLKSKLRELKNTKKMIVASIAAAQAGPESDAIDDEQRKPSPSPPAPLVPSPALSSASQLAPHPAALPASHPV
jgi:septal ring factor EnvC (AmiA/AmiB activator)